MPEITEAQHREYLSFLALQQSPTEITAKVAKLEKDNQKQRDEIRERDEKLKALPAEGAKVLTADEAKEWEAFQGLALPAKDIKAAVEERDTLKTASATREKRDALGKAVDTEGWVPESATLLHRLLGDAPFEVKTEKVEVVKNGQKVQEDKPVGYVTVDGKSVRLSAWAEAEQLPASMFTARPGSESDRGREWVPQRGGGGNADKVVEGGVDAALEANQKAATKANPLRPAKAT